VVLAGAVAWWFIYRPLPQLDGSIPLSGLQKEVTVERDNWGVPHIRAASLADAVEAQGYVMAQDRLWQLDLMRRASRGQLAEIVGPLALKSDKQFRTFGFSRAAERDFAAMDKDSRALMEAYARGVNVFIEQHQNSLPLEFSLLKYKPQPWQPTDSLVIAGYMYQTLTDTWERELDRAKVENRVGPDRSKDLFAIEAPMDHFVVGDPDAPKDGSQASRVDPDDEDDDDDMPTDTILKAARRGSGSVRTPETFADVTSALWPSIEGYLEEMQSEIRQGLGSNNWVVSGAHTATGIVAASSGSRDCRVPESRPSRWQRSGCFSSAAARCTFLTAIRCGRRRTLTSAFPTPAAGARGKAAVNRARGEHRDRLAVPRGRLRITGTQAAATHHQDAPTLEPRLTAVPVRLPLPPAAHQGSIYQNQRAAGRRYFATADRAVAAE